MKWPVYFTLCFLTIIPSLTAKDKSSMDLKKEQEQLNKKFKDCCADITSHTISAKNAKNLYTKKSNIIFIDNRKSNEQDVSMIKGAIRAEDFNPEKADKSKQYIIYCTIGYRSGKMTEKLRKKGLEAFNLEGGIYAWTYENGPIIDKASKETKEVHIYSSSWNYLRSDFKAVN